MFDLLFTGDCFVQTRDGSVPFKKEMKEKLSDIKEQGFKRVMDMIRWYLHPSTYIYYVGAIMSLFVRNPKY